MRSLSTSTDCVDRFFKAFIVMKAIISDNSFTRGFHLLVYQNQRNRTVEVFYPNSGYQSKTRSLCG